MVERKVSLRLNAVLALFFLSLTFVIICVVMYFSHTAEISKRKTTALIDLAAVSSSLVSRVQLLGSIAKSVEGAMIMNMQIGAEQAAKYIASSSQAPIPTQYSTTAGNYSSSAMPISSVSLFPPHLNTALPPYYSLLTNASIPVYLRQKPVPMFKELVEYAINASFGQLRNQTVVVVTFGVIANVFPLVNASEVANLRPSPPLPGVDLLKSPLYRDSLLKTINNGLPSLRFSLNQTKLPGITPVDQIVMFELPLYVELSGPRNVSNYYGSVYVYGEVSLFIADVVSDVRYKRDGPRSIVSRTDTNADHIQPLYDICAKWWDDLTETWILVSGTSSAPCDELEYDPEQSKVGNLGPGLFLRFKYIAPKPMWQDANVIPIVCVCWLVGSLALVAAINAIVRVNTKQYKGWMHAPRGPNTTIVSDSSSRQQLTGNASSLARDAPIPISDFGHGLLILRLNGLSELHEQCPDVVSEIESIFSVNVAKAVEESKGYLIPNTTNLGMGVGLDISSDDNRTFDLHSALDGQLRADDFGEIKNNVFNNTNENQSQLTQTTLGRSGNSAMTNDYNNRRFDVNADLLGVTSRRMSFAIATKTLEQCVTIATDIQEIMSKVAKHHIMNLGTKWNDDSDFSENTNQGAARTATSIKGSAGQAMDHGSNQQPDISNNAIGMSPLSGQQGLRSRFHPSINGTGRNTHLKFNSTDTDRNLSAVHLVSVPPTQKHNSPFVENTAIQDNWHNANTITSPPEKNSGQKPIAKNSGMSVSFEVCAVIQWCVGTTIISFDNGIITESGGGASQARQNQPTVKAANKTTSKASSPKRNINLKPSPVLGRFKKAFRQLKESFSSSALTSSSDNETSFFSNYGLVDVDHGEHWVAYHGIEVDLAFDVALRAFLPSTLVFLPAAYEYLIGKSLSTSVTDGKNKNSLQKIQSIFNQSSKPRTASYMLPYLKIEEYHGCFIPLVDKMYSFCPSTSSHYQSSPEDALGKSNTNKHLKLHSRAKGPSSSTPQSPHSPRGSIQFLVTPATNPSISNTQVPFHHPTCFPRQVLVQRASTFASAIPFHIPSKNPDTFWWPLYAVVDTRHQALHTSSTKACMARKRFICLPSSHHAFKASKEKNVMYPPVSPTVHSTLSATQLQRLLAHGNADGSGGEALIPFELPLRPTIVVSSSIEKGRGGGNITFGERSGLQRKPVGLRLALGRRLSNNNVKVEQSDLDSTHTDIIVPSISSKNGSLRKVKDEKEINSYIQAQQTQQRSKTNPSSSLLNTLNPHQNFSQEPTQKHPTDARMNSNQVTAKEDDPSSRDNIAPIIEIIQASQNNESSMSQFCPHNEKVDDPGQTSASYLNPVIEPSGVHQSLGKKAGPTSTSIVTTAGTNNLIKQHQLAMLNSWTSIRALADGTKGLIGAGSALTHVNHQNEASRNIQVNEDDAGKDSHYLHPIRQPTRDHGNDGSQVSGATQLTLFPQTESKFSLGGTDTNTFVMSFQQFAHNNEKVHENAKIFAVRFFNIPPSTRDVLSESFRIQSLLDNLSFNACLGTIYPFLVAYQFIMTALAPAERKNMTVRLIAAFGVPKEHTFENLAVRCAIIFLSSLPKAEREKFTKTVTHSKSSAKLAKN